VKASLLSAYDLLLLFVTKSFVQSCGSGSYSTSKTRPKVSTGNSKILDDNFMSQNRAGQDVTNRNKSIKRHLPFL
jgi:hypothetical protein